MAKPRTRRGGFTLAEASIGLVLAMAGSALVVNLAVTSLMHAARVDERFLAQEELSNLRERSIASGAQSISDEWLKKQGLTGPARDKLDQAKLEWKKEWIDPQTGKSAEKRSAADQANWPIRLTATLTWKADKGGANLASATWVLAPTVLKSAGAPGGGS